MNRPTLMALAAAALILGACASVSVHHYTLLPVGEELPDDRQAAGFLIELLPVGVPAHLDQPQLVVRRGPTGIVVLDGERWAGPLSEEFRDALSAGITAHLQTRDIAGLSGPVNEPVLRIRVEVRRLDAWPGDKVSLDADWTLGFSDEAATARRVGGDRFETPVSDGYPELILGHQRVVAMLAERIVADVRDQGSGIRDQGSGIRDQGSGIRDQGSGIRDQGSG
ncbi:MAG: PqiC family protein, partial [Candidatus Accumulibacter sp.]|nr:PqiC family protein [Accumulibacter sp.]